MYLEEGKSTLRPISTGYVWSAPGLQVEVWSKTSLRKRIRPLGGDQLSWPWGVARVSVLL